MSEDPRVTTRSSKEKILEAYRVMKEQRDQLKANTLDPAAIERAREQGRRENIRSKVEINFGGFTQALSEFEDTSATILDTLKARAELGEEQLHTLESTIKEKREQIKELSDIEAEIGTLAALVQARGEMEEANRLETEAAKRRHAAELVKLQETLNDEHARTLDEHSNAVLATQKAELKRQDDWQYGFERDCRTKLDAFHDDLETRTKHHNEHVENALKELIERETSIKEREAVASDLDAALTHAKEQIAKLEATREQVIQVHVNKAREEAAKTQDNVIRAINERHNSKLEVEKERVIMRDQQVAQLQEQTAQLQADLKDAQKRINDLALRSIDNTHATKATDAIRAMAEQTAGAAVAGKANSKN